MPYRPRQEYTGRLCVPGMPKTTSTPCAASAPTSASPPVIRAITPRPSPMYRPGLGVELNLDVIERHPYLPMPLRTFQDRWGAIPLI